MISPVKVPTDPIFPTSGRQIARHKPPVGGQRATFHLQGQHDQQNHAGGRGAEEQSWRGWHPAEGITSDRPVEVSRDAVPAGERTYRVTAANGQVVEARVFASSDSGRERLSSPEWQQRTVDILNGATDGYDAAPTEVPPNVIVIDELPFGLPAEAQLAIAMVPVSQTRAGQQHESLPFSADQVHGNTIMVNGSAMGDQSWEVMSSRLDIMMPSAEKVGIARYTGVHEYGHTRAGFEDDIPLLTEMYDELRPQSLSNISTEWKSLSRYGKVNPAEAHAETFADWVLTGGNSTNAATQFYSDTLEWYRLDGSLAAAAGTARKLTQRWLWALDGPEGGTLITKASEMTFHLDGQHDQQSHAGGGVDTGSGDWEGEPIFHGARFEAKVGDIIEPRKAIHGNAAFATPSLEDAQRFSMNGFGPSSVVRVEPVDPDDVVKLQPDPFYSKEYASPSGFKVIEVISSDPGDPDQFAAMATLDPVRIVRSQSLRVTKPEDLLDAWAKGKELSQADAAFLTDWVRGQMTGDDPEEFLKIALTALDRTTDGEFHLQGQHDQQKHAGGGSGSGPDWMSPADRRYRSERSRRAGEAGRKAAQEAQAKAEPPSRRIDRPSGNPVLGYRPGDDAKGIRRAKDWLRDEFFPTGEFDIGDFGLALFTLPANLLFAAMGAPQQNDDRLLLAAETRVFHLEGQHDQASHAGGRGKTADEGTFAPITAAEARGNSRPVSSEEFQRLAAVGQQQIDELAADTQPIGLDENWDSIQQQAFDAAQESWGGATIEARTGEFLASDADRYALTVKEPGMETVTVPEGASADEFNAAMTEARDKFRPILERRDHYLGVFHDDDLNRIDFDPVTVVDSLDKVETIGAATRAIGGAYNFADGNGYWPPHVDDDAVVASASMASMKEKTKFKGPAEWKRQAKQLEGAPDAAPEAKKTRKFTDPK